MEKILSDIESNKIKEKFFDKLSETYEGNHISCKDYWYPLRKIKENIPVISFDSCFLDDADILGTIKTYLKDTE